MHQIAAKFVPRVLTLDQKDSRVVICQELKETVINNPTLLLNVFTGDVSIVYAYNPETELQSSQWKSPGSPGPKKARMQKSKLKMMLICFFDQEGIVHREFVPPGMTVNADFYCDVLRRLRENVWRKRPQKWQNQNLIIHHDNAPAHRSFKVSQFLATNNMIVVPHPPYSPDLYPCDFFLFPKLKLRMKCRRFETIEEIQEESQRKLDKFQTGTSRNAGTAVFLQKGSTLKVMEEFNIQVKQTSFYKHCPGTFGYTLVVQLFICQNTKHSYLTRVYPKVPGQYL